MLSIFYKKVKKVKKKIVRENSYNLVELLILEAVAQEFSLKNS